MPDYSLGSAPRELPTTALERATSLAELLVRHATGSREDDDLYRELRRDLVRRTDLAHLVPPFVKSCRTLSGFWSWIKAQSGQWEPRRAIIREAFAELLDRLEEGDDDPADAPITEALTQFDETGVRLAWSKALDRRRDDPEGAITSARTLLETVCKKVLDDAEQTYEDNDDLPKLYGLASASLMLAPNDHTEKIFRSILGSCQNIVNSLGTLRNRLGDAHGQGRKKARPLPRHAALAVNLAGSMALFLVETSAARRDQRKNRELKLNDPRFVEHVLYFIKFSDVVRKYVQLEKDGKEWKGRSPFEDKPTKSFYVNDKRSFYHCFSTGKHGSPVNFLMEIEGLPKSEAVSVLAQQAGLHVDDWDAEDAPS